MFVQLHYYKDKINYLVQELIVRANDTNCCIIHNLTDYSLTFLFPTVVSHIHSSCRQHKQLYAPCSRHPAVLTKQLDTNTKTRFRCVNSGTPDPETRCRVVTSVQEKDMNCLTFQILLSWKQPRKVVKIVGRSVVVHKESGDSPVSIVS